LYKGCIDPFVFELFVTEVRGSWEEWWTYDGISGKLTNQQSVIVSLVYCLLIVIIGFDIHTSTV
jgi:hypothetical protein